MKKLFTLIAFAILAFVIAPMQTKASHLAGAEITYAPTANPGEYLVKLSIYRDCSSATQVLSSYDLCYTSASLGGSVSSTFTVNQTSIDTVGASPCVAALQGSTCFLGTGDIEVFRFEGTFTPPAAANDWIITFYECCRNAAITTLVDPDTWELNVHTLLDNLDVTGNSSPVFRSPAYTRFCVGNLFNYAQDATDPDGDSLNFSLVVPQKGSCPDPSIPFDYVPDFNGNPYTATNPFESTIPITIDPHTGTMVFIPAAQQVAVIALRVEEFRGGIKIGEVNRDIQIKITAQCLPIIPAFSQTTIGSSTVSGHGGGYYQVNCNDRTIILPLDTVYPIQCASAIPSDFRTLSPYGIPNPVVAVTPINCINGLTDSLLVTFLNPFSMGITKLWSKKGFDGNTFLGQCGYELVASQDTVFLYVDTTIISTLTPQVDSIGCVFNTFDLPLSDSIYCYSIAADGSDFILTDAAGIQYPITSAYGYCVPNGLKTNKVLINTQGNVSGTPPYYVTVSSALLDGNTLADDCARMVLSGDTLGVLYSNNRIAVNLGADQKVCGSSGSLPQLDANIPGLSYQWFNTAGAISGATSQTYSVSQSDTYIVQVNASPSCQGRDTIVVDFVAAPTDSLGSDISQCINDALPVLNAGDFGTGTQYEWYFNGFVIGGETSQHYTPTSTNSGTYSVLVSTGNGVCQVSFDVDLNVFNTYPVNTLSNEDICAGGTATQLDAGAAALANGIQWLVGGNAIPGATTEFYTPTTSGTYSVQVGTGSCASTSSMTFNVVPTPTPTLNNVNLCDPSQLTALNPGSTSGATYQWSFNGNPISGATNNTYLPASGNGTYSVDVTVTPGCTGTASSVVNLNSIPTFDVKDTTICADGTAVLDAHYVSAGTPTYLWSTGATTQTISTNVQGWYSVTISESTCSGNDSAYVTVNNYPVAPVVACGTIAGNQYKYVYTWASIPGAVSYEISEDGGTTWVAANAASGTTESHGTNAITADFVVRALGTIPCATGVASEKTACEVHPPNIITPNGDGKNDFFKIENIEQYPRNSVQIFNRWGKEVYSKDAYNNSDSKFDGKDVPDGTYFYIINLNQENKAPLSGTLTIIK